MYSPPLHKVFTQAVGSSQVFSKMISRKATEVYQKNDKRWDKKTTKDLEHVCHKQENEFLSCMLDCCRQRQVCREGENLHDLSPSLHATLLIIESGEKYCNKIKRFGYLHTELTFHKTKFTISNAALSRYPTFLPSALHSEVRFSVWKGQSIGSTFVHLI